MRKTALSIVILFLTALCAFGQGDGPKAMLLAPTNLNLITPAYLNMSNSG